MDFMKVPIVLRRGSMPPRSFQILSGFPATEGRRTIEESVSIMNATHLKGVNDLVRQVRVFMMWNPRKPPAPRSALFELFFPIPIKTMTVFASIWSIPARMKSRPMMWWVPLLALSLGAQIEVSSFAELIPYLDDDDVNIVMTPGVYRITRADAKSEIFPNPTLLEFSGSNSTFDFTGVTIEVETMVFRSYGSIDVKEVSVIGSHLVLKNLTIHDVGDDRPQKTALGVLLDGTDNRIEGFHLTVRGSYPYGYGDLFGKGSGYVIKHFKHSAVLIRGQRNHLKDTTVLHRAYGHGIFCQGSIDALIEGCYVEGETRTTDEVLAEAGTGSPAEEVDFMTVWGWPVQPGHTFSLQEDGIRAYNIATSADGIERNTTNMRVIDCTVKNMRSGITIGFCDGEKYVEGCTVEGVEGAYWVGSGGQIVDCAGNAPYGTLYSNAYQNDKNSVVDITVLDHGEPHGSGILAYIAGSGHNLTFRGDKRYLNTDLRIMVAGDRNDLRFFEFREGYDDLSASGITLNNLTGYPVVMGEKSVGTTGQTGGEVTDEGTSNQLTSIEVDTCGGFGILQTIEAEYFCDQSGIEIQSEADGTEYITAIDDGDWLKFDNLFLGSGPDQFAAQVASNGAGGTIELRLDRVDGTLIGTCTVDSTGGSLTWDTAESDLERHRGLHDLYLVFRGESGQLFNLDAFIFSVWLPDHTWVPEEEPVLPMVFRMTKVDGGTKVEWTAADFTGYSILRSTDFQTWSRDRRRVVEEGDNRNFVITPSDAAAGVFFVIESSEF